MRITAAPWVGEHTREVCRDLLGMADEEIESLVAGRSAGGHAAAIELADLIEASAKPC